MVSFPHTLSRSGCECPRPNGPRTREELSTIYIHMTRMIYRVTFIAHRSSTLYQCIYCFQGRGGLHARLPPHPPGAQKILDFQGDPPGGHESRSLRAFFASKSGKKASYKKSDYIIASNSSSSIALTQHVWEAKTADKNMFYSAYELGCTQRPGTAKPVSAARSHHEQKLALFFFFFVFAGRCDSGMLEIARGRLLPGLRERMTSTYIAIERSNEIEEM